jgi:PKD repeat protein
MSTNQTVRAYPAPEPTPDVRIDFSPHGVVYTYNVGEESYAPANTFWANVNTALTLTATVVFSGVGQSAAGYEWRFGDGTTGFTNPVVHTYALTSEVPVTLIITDNRGQEFRAYKTLYVH